MLFACGRVQLVDLNITLFGLLLPRTVLLQYLMDDSFPYKALCYEYTGCVPWPQPTTLIVARARYGGKA